MRNFYILATMLILSACGGGGSVTPLATLEIQTTPPESGGGGSTSTSIPEGTYAPTRVIDGYISGANVFVDMNYNFQQDNWEPSAYEDIQGEYYYFDSNDFTHIDNYDESCLLQRPRIAEVPVGAIDSTRGVVNEAYELYFVPYRNFQTSAEGVDAGNVTPFTTFLIDMISVMFRNVSITEENACSNESRDYSYSFMIKVQDALNELENRFGLDTESFYDDFIASGDTEKQAIAERLVDFLQIAYKAMYAIEEEYNISTYSNLDYDLFNRILNGEEINDISFNIISITRGITEEIVEGEEWLVHDIYRVMDMYVNSSGQYYDIESGTIYEPTMDNLKLYGKFDVSNVQTSIFNIFDNISVTLEYQVMEKTIDDAERHYIIAFSNSNFLEYRETNNYRRVKSNNFYIQLHNENNPYFDYDVLNIFETRYPLDLQNLFDDINTIETNMPNFYMNQSYLYEGDNQRKSNGSWQYWEHVDYDGLLYKTCLDYDTETEWTGEEAYDMCLNNIE